MGGGVRLPRRERLPDGAHAQGMDRHPARARRRAGHVQAIYLLRSGAHHRHGHSSSARGGGGGDARKRHDAARLRAGRVAHAPDWPRATPRAHRRPGGGEARRRRRRRGGGSTRVVASRRTRAIDGDGSRGSRAKTTPRRARVVGGERHARRERAGGSPRRTTRREHLAQTRVPRAPRRGRARDGEQRRRGSRTSMLGRVSRTRVVRRLQRGAARILRVQTSRDGCQRTLRVAHRRREGVEGVAVHPARGGRHGGIHRGTSREIARSGGVGARDLDEGRAGARGRAHRGRSRRRRER